MLKGRLARVLEPSRHRGRVDSPDLLANSQQATTLRIDPVMPPALDGLCADMDPSAHDVELSYRLQASGAVSLAPGSITGSLQITHEHNPYRRGAALVSGAELMQAINTSSGTTALLISIGDCVSFRLRVAHRSTLSDDAILDDAILAASSWTVSATTHAAARIDASLPSVSPVKSLKLMCLMRALTIVESAHEGARLHLNNDMYKSTFTASWEVLVKLSMSEKQGRPMRDARLTESALLVQGHISRLTRQQFLELTRRLALYAARLLRGDSLDHHAHEIVSGAMDRALDGRRQWDPLACSFESFLFGVVRSRASTLRRSPGARMVRIAAQLPLHGEGSVDVLAELADEKLHADTLPSIEAEQERERLTRNVAKIDATLAQILVMAFYEGRTNLDIVGRLNVSIREVENGRKRLQRILKRLYSLDCTNRGERRHPSGKRRSTGGPATAAACAAPEQT